MEDFCTESEIEPPPGVHVLRSIAVSVGGCTLPETIYKKNSCQLKLTWKIHDFDGTFQEGIFPSYNLKKADGLKCLEDDLWEELELSFYSEAAFPLEVHVSL